MCKHDHPPSSQCQVGREFLTQSRVQFGRLRQHVCSMCLNAQCPMCLGDESKHVSQNLYPALTMVGASPAEVAHPRRQAPAHCAPAGSSHSVPCMWDLGGGGRGVCRLNRRWCLQYGSAVLMPSLAGVQKAHAPGDKAPLTASLPLESGTPYAPPTDLELAAYSAGVGSLHGSTLLASVHRTVSLAVSAQQHLSDSRVHSSRDLHAPISRCPQRSRKILCLAWAGKARSLAGL